MLDLLTFKAVVQLTIMVTSYYMHEYNMKKDFVQAIKKTLFFSFQKNCLECMNNVMLTFFVQGFSLL